MLDNHLNQTDVTNFYDFLEKLIARVPWHTEKEKEEYTKLIQKLRDVNVFGFMVSNITIENPESDRTPKQPTWRNW